MSAHGAWTAHRRSHLSRVLQAAYVAQELKDSRDLGSQGVQPTLTPQRWAGLRAAGCACSDRWQAPRATLCGSAAGTTGRDVRDRRAGTQRPAEPAGSGRPARRRAKSCARAGSAAVPGGQPLDHCTVVTDHGASEIFGSPFTSRSHAIPSVITCENMGQENAGQGEIAWISHLLVWGKRDDGLRSLQRGYDRATSAA